MASNLVRNEQLKLFASFFQHPRPCNLAAGSIIPIVNLGIVGNVYVGVYLPFLVGTSWAFYCSGWHTEL